MENTFSTTVSLDDGNEIDVYVEVDANVDYQTDIVEYWGAKCTVNYTEVEIENFKIFADGEQELFDENGDNVLSMLNDEELIDESRLSNVQSLINKIESFISDNSSSNFSNVIL